MSHSPEDCVMGLMLVVDTQSPSASQVQIMLTELAQSVLSQGAAARESVISLGAYAIVCRAWLACCAEGGSDINSSEGIGVRCAVLNALYALTPGNSEIMDDFGWQIIADCLEKTVPEQITVQLLKLLRNVFIKSEDNRELFSWTLGLTDQLVSLILKPKVTAEFLLEWCSALKALFLSDDPRVVLNRSAERKQPLAKAKVVATVADFLQHKEYEGEPGALNAAVIFLASLAVSEELRLQMDTGGVLNGIHGIFRNQFENKVLLRNTITLLRLLCVSKKLRDKSGSLAQMKYIVDAMDNYKSEADIVEEAISCCAYMTLRSPCHVAQFLAKNGLSLVQQLMSVYSQETSIVKSICFTLRNVAENGGGHARDKIKESGLESALREVILRSPGLEQLYVSPILNEIKSSSKTNLANKEAYSEPTLEPQHGRHSVVVDDPESD